MRGYHSTLGRSVAILAVFYSSISFLLFYLMGPRTLASWLAERGFWNIEENPIVPVTQGLAVASNVAIEQAVRSAPFILVGVIFSFLFTGVIVLILRRLRNQRGLPAKEADWRELSVTLSQIPKVQEPNYEAVKITLPSSVDEIYRPLICALIAYIKTNNHVHAGDGHGVSLLEHTVGVIKRALNLEGADPLLPVVAAAHDIGKIMTFKQSESGWKRTGYHDKAGAQLLASLPQWWALPDTERRILLYSVKYEHSSSLLPTKIPGLDIAGRERVLKTLSQIKEIDQTATREEKEKVVEQAEKETSLLHHFLNIAPELCFQTQGMAKGLKAVGWRVGNRLYLLEWGIRKAIEPLLSNDAQAALETGYEQGQRLPLFTKKLLEQFKEKGWLVTSTEIEGEDGNPEVAKARASFPLWRIRTRHKKAKENSQGHVFKWVIILELPESESHWFPEETPYRITVQKPEKSAAAQKKKTTRRKKSHNIEQNTEELAIAPTDAIFVVDSAEPATEVKTEKVVALDAEKPPKKKRRQRKSSNSPAKPVEPQEGEPLLDAIVFGEPQDEATN